MTNPKFIFMSRPGIIVFLIVGYIFCIKNLNAQNTPGENFDLSAWKLQTLAESDSSYMQVNPINTHHSRFFYTNNADGAMTFRVPSNGGTTSANASYPRVELRQISAGANWPLSDVNEHYLTAQCSVTEISEEKPKTIIGQIHGSESNSELLKIRWTGYTPGNCFVEARFQTNDDVGSEYGIILASNLSLGDLIDYSVTMIQGEVNVTINGNTATQTYTSEHYGTTDQYYFKAGNYIQWNEDIVGPTVVSGESLFYKLSLERTTSTTIENNSHPFSIYPNPAKNQVTFKSDLITQSNISIEIIDAKGVLAKKISLSPNQTISPNTHQINLSNLNSGTYFVRFISDHFLENRKLIISK